MFRAHWVEFQQPANSQKLVLDLAPTISRRRAKWLDQRSELPPQHQAFHSHQKHRLVRNTWPRISSLFDVVSIISFIVLALVINTRCQAHDGEIDHNILYSTSVSQRPEVC